MRIRLEDPELVPDLLTFFQRVRCTVRRQGEMLEVSVPEAPTAEQAGLEIELYFLAWRALHPEATATLLSAPTVVPSQPHH